MIGLGLGAGLYRVSGIEPTKLHRSLSCGVLSISVPELLFTIVTLSCFYQRGNGTLEISIRNVQTLSTMTYNIFVQLPPSGIFECHFPLVDLEEKSLMIIKSESIQHTIIELNQAHHSSPTSPKLMPPLFHPLPSSGTPRAPAHKVVTAKDYGRAARAHSFSPHPSHHQ